MREQKYHKNTLDNLSVNIIYIHNVLSTCIILSDVYNTRLQSSAQDILTENQICEKTNNV